ncbi:MAG: hypothetical protein ACSHX9_11850 [Luteolibacter sp.]
MKFLLWPFIAAACLLLSSCFETEQEFTLNPDGTGKVVMNSVFPNISFDGDDEQTDESLKKAVADFIKETEGVEVWRDVSYSWTDDGRVKFQGTAYFADISELDFKNVGTMNFAWEKNGDKGVLTMAFEESDDDGEQKEVTKDPEERKKEMKIERQKFQQSKPMMTGVLTGLKHRAVFNLPGNSESSVNFKVTQGGKIGIEVTGEKMISAIEQLVNDDAWLLENSFDPQEGPANGEDMNEALFGQKGAVKAERSGLDKPLFDYAAEVAAARKDFEKLQEEFTGPIAPPATGEAMKSLKVMGLQISQEIDKKLGFRPFNSDPGLKICVVGEFPGSILAVSEIMLETATGDDGSDLLPEKGWDRKASFPRLSDTNTDVMFELKFETPKPTMKSFSEIAGNIQYTVSSGVKETDLGMSALKVGEKGTELSAEITEIKDGWNDDGSKVMEIKLSLDSDSVKSLVMVDGAKRRELEKRGHSSFGNGPTTFTFESEDGFPENAKLFVVAYDGVKTFDVPFSLKDVSLDNPFGKD